MQERCRGHVAEMSQRCRKDVEEMCTTCRKHVIMSTSPNHVPIHEYATSYKSQRLQKKKQKAAGCEGKRMARSTSGLRALGATRPFGCKMLCPLLSRQTQRTNQRHQKKERPDL